MLRNFVIKHDQKVNRFLEILPGFVSWNLILFPYWGIFVFPEVVAYYLLAYVIYWFYQSLQIAISATVSHLRIQASMKRNWLADLKEFPNWQKVIQVIIVPTYKEPLHILERTFDSIAKQTLSKKQITVILAMEKNEDESERKLKVAELKKKFGKKLPNFYVTTHKLKSDEIAGKSSNEKHAAIWFKKNIIDKENLDIANFVVTSCDADHIFHKNHFALLTHNFLVSPYRYKRFWQAAVLFYNNVWRLPSLTRVPNTLGSIWNLSQLPRRDRLISTSNYSLSYKLLDEAGYWDADKIPEDWGVFFKAYYKKRGGVEVEPIYLPVYADAVESTGFIKTMKSQYEQRKRWAWGVSDDAWIIRKYLTVSGVPFIEKTMRTIYVIQSHFFWPVHWFAITLGLTIPALLNPAFGRTALGHTVPRLSSIILSISLIFLGVMLVLDRTYKPKRPKNFPLWRAALMPLEFLLMPIVGFIFSALPGMDAHTRLMFGKYMDYRVTEKV